MCGICGKVSFDDRPVTEWELRRMAASLAHRGPDGEGFWSRGTVGLGHRRLAIIDLRATASQPMSNEDGSVWVTFNGEIYNFQELRRTLQGRGHTFRTASDTEVVVHAYEEYGRHCLDHFRGMFALAVWDTRTRVLFLARDRVGKKPLFYYVGSDCFLFGSEIKALLTDRRVPIEPDPVALDAFLAFGFIPAPRTAFQGIRKLPAAHWLEVRDGQVSMGRYWKLHYTPKLPLAEPEAVAELQWRLAEAVRLRLQSDVPLGAFLSGGMDSSAVVALMARAMDRPVQTFAAGFEQAAFDERPFARQVATRYGTAHTELMVKAPVLDMLPRLIWHYDEPLGDSSAIPSYAIAQLTRQHVTVVLNGDGGDENFAGYDWHLLNRRAHRGDVVPWWARRGFAAALRRVPAGWRACQPLARLAAIAEVAAQPPGRRYARWLSHLPPAARRQLYTEAFHQTVADSDPEALFARTFQQSDANDWTDAALDVDVNLYLVDDLLVKMDRATMAHSLEARSPFLDHEFMEFAARLPASLKLSGTQRKHILKKMLHGVLPDTVLERRKMGFSVPLASWFRHELRPMAYDVLLAPRAIQRGYFQPEILTTWLTEHSTGRHDHAAVLWDLLVLELWHRAFVDGEMLGALR